MLAESYRLRPQGTIDRPSGVGVWEASVPWAVVMELMGQEQVVEEEVAEVEGAADPRVGRPMGMRKRRTMTIPFWEDRVDFR